jgi:predicted HTH transcriptional regulator
MLTMPLDKPLDEIDESDLEKLIFDRVAECKTIEYKQALPSKSDDDKREFLADASSFANAAGGHLIYGIREEAGQPVDLCGLPDGTNDDSEILALESSVRNGIAPRLTGVHSKAVSIRGGRVAIVIRIPKSFASPHMVTY